MANGRRIALVTWLDAKKGEEEITASEPVGVIRESVGWVLRDDKQGVTIAMSHDEGPFSRGFLIPRIYVRSVAYMQKVK